MVYLYEIVFYYKVTIQILVDSEMYDTELKRKILNTKGSDIKTAFLC